MRKKVEQLWSSEKYRVMFHSQKHYNDIRIAMRNQASYDEVAVLIAEAIEVEPTDGSQRNAIQHMWGYFKKFATVMDKQQYEQLMQQYEFEQLLNFIARLAKQYEVDYLLQSTIVAKYKA